jgi:uncharacterized protein (DUF433 family)
LEADVGWRCDTHAAMTHLALLARERSAAAAAARLLDVAQSTLHYWLEGKTGRGGKVHRPVIRREPKGTGAAVTWAEFVEAGLLRQYRRELKVPLPELRAFIDLLRTGFDVPYPLADRRPYASGKALVLEAQEAAGLPGDFWLVTVAAGQLLLTPASESFLRRARWEGEVATGWRPHEEQDSAVLIDPTVRFGRPAVGGISTEAIWEHSEDGEDDEEIAEIYGLTPREVAWALAYEKPRRARATQRIA